MMNAPEDAFGDGAGFFAEAIDADFGPEKIAHHCWHERAREEIGREHGEDDGHGKRSKQITRGASEQQHGDEDDADGDGGDKRRDGDLARAIENGA